MTQPFYKVGKLYHHLHEHIISQPWFRKLVPKHIRSKIIRTYYHLYAMRQAWKDIHVDASAFENGKVKILVVKGWQIFRNEYWDKTYNTKKDGSIVDEFAPNNKLSCIGEYNALLLGCKVADRNQKIITDSMINAITINNDKPDYRYANRCFYKQLVAIRHLKSKKNLKIEYVSRERNAAGLLLENDIVFQRINGDTNDRKN